MNPMRGDPLRRALWLHVFGLWKNSILLLEPLVPLYRDSAEFYNLLGSGFLRSGDFRTAKTYLARAHQIAPSDRGLSMKLVAAQLGSGEAGESAALCLDLLEKNPGDKPAARAMELMRKGEGRPRGRQNGSGSKEAPEYSYRALMSILPAERCSLIRTALGVAGSSLILVIVLVFLLSNALSVRDGGLRQGIDPIRRGRTNESGSAESE